MCRNWVSLLFCLWLCNCANAQRPARDTIYFDDNWSVCQKPVAAYYRVTKLVLNLLLMPADTTEDYRIDHSLYMRGYYNADGRKQGTFTFYNKKGTIIKQIEFVDNLVKGQARFFNDDGTLRAHFNCKSATDLTPLFLMDRRGDTLLTNGEGSFMFNTFDDLAGVFSYNTSYTVMGAVKNGKKDGDFYYWERGSNLTKRWAVGRETYENGKFKRGYLPRNRGTATSEPMVILNVLNGTHLPEVDFLQSRNIVFNPSKAYEEVFELISHGREPMRYIPCKSWYDNYLLLGGIIGSALQKSMDSEQEYFAGQIKSTTRLVQNIGTINRRLNLQSKLPVPEFIATITIDTNGRFDKSVFTGKIAPQEAERINYYLSHIYGAHPLEKKGRPVMTEMTLKLHAILDTLSDGMLQPYVSCKYMLYSNDSTDQPISLVEYGEDATYDAFFIFAGSLYQQYIESQVDRQVPYVNNALPGRYETKVKFTINAKGQVEDVKIKDDPGFGMGTEVARVVKMMPDWVPARKEGRPVSVSKEYTVVFKVESE